MSKQEWSRQKCRAYTIRGNVCAMVGAGSTEIITRIEQDEHILQGTKCHRITSTILVASSFFSDFITIIIFAIYALRPCAQTALVCVCCDGTLSSNIFCIFFLVLSIYDVKVWLRFFTAFACERFDMGIIAQMGGLSLFAFLKT